MNGRVAVPGVGPHDAQIVLVGEQPGKSEMIERTPFVGPAGRVLNECLQMAGIVRGDCYLTNVVKTLEASLETYFVYPKKGSPYFTPQGLLYVEILKRELEALPWNVCVAVGNVALFALTGRVGITKWRGSLLESTLFPGRKVIPVIHPATVLPDKGQFLNKRLIFWDLKRAAQNSKYPEIVREPREVITRPSFDMVMQYLEEMKVAGISGDIIDIDIESDMNTNHITTISLTNSRHRSISIPFIYWNGDYFTPLQEVAIWRKIGSIIGDARITKRGQNFIFDLHFKLRRLGIIPRGRIHDTMVAQKILMPDYKAGLDFIVSIHTDIPYYKDEGKKWIKTGDGTWDAFWKYNGLDTMSTADAGPKQLRLLANQGNSETYDRQTAIIYPLLYMQERGIRVDVQGMMAYRQEAIEKSDAILARIKELAGFDLNPNSPPQVKDLFYNRLGIKPYMKRDLKTRRMRVTTDSEALKRILRQGYEVAGLILEYRFLKSKVIGTYTDPTKISADGRMRTQYNPGRTETGRLASSENAFDEGSNQQNWPHKIMEFLIADEGYITLTFDLSQAENRIVAYEGRVFQMIEAFEQGKDIHALTGALISGLTVEVVIQQDKDNIYVSIGDGKKTWRFWGKKTNHGLNYRQGYRRFALQNEIPDMEGKRLVEAYHRAFPGVRGNYHAGVIASLNKDRTLINLMGRKRLFLDELNDNTYNEACAQIPQSTVADVINKRGILFVYDNPDPYLNVLYKPFELLTQIHDSITGQVPVAVGWMKIAEMVLCLKQSLETPLVTSHGIEFVIPADLTIGFTLNKEAKSSRDIKAAKMPGTVEEVAALLETTYNELKAIREAELEARNVSENIPGITVLPFDFEDQKV